jgi:hypothetical protein
MFLQMPDCHAILECLRRPIDRQLINVADEVGLGASTEDDDGRVMSVLRD